MILLLWSNSQIVDTAEGNFSAGQFIGVDIDSEKTLDCAIVENDKAGKGYLFA